MGHVIHGYKIAPIAHTLTISHLLRLSSLLWVVNFRQLNGYKIFSSLDGVFFSVTHFDKSDTCIGCDLCELTAEVRCTLCSFIEYNKRVATKYRDCRSNRAIINTICTTSSVLCCCCVIKYDWSEGFD